MCYISFKPCASDRFLKTPVNKYNHIRISHALFSSRFAFHGNDLASSSAQLHIVEKGMEIGSA